MPYGYPGPAPGPAQPEDDEQASMNEMLRSVLEMLEPSPQYPAPQAPQQPGPGRRIMGGIGDALLSMASVRAGGGPVAMGPYAAQQDRAQQQYQAQLQEHEKRTMENAAADRVLRNQTRIGAFRGAQDLRQAKEVAGMRTIRAMRPLQLKQFRTKDTAGRPQMIPYNYDPNTGNLAPAPGYEQGFDQFVRPFLAQGVNTETGQMEFRLLDPFSGSGVGDGGQSTGPIDEGDPRYGGGGGNTDKIEGFEPKPTAGEIESAEAATVIRDQLAMFKDLASKYKGGQRIAGGVRATGQGVVRAIPLIGKPLSESLGDPDYEELSALRGRIGQQLARLVENGRLSDQDRDFALENLPTVESLTTESGRGLAAAKLGIVEREIETRITRRSQLRPGLMRGSGRAPSSRSGAYTGRTLPAAAFDRLPPDRRESEKQKFIDGGGTILEGQ